jgi:cyclopropane fatty-acyl-phospholipid synthase-like methyltransferase
VSHFCPKGEELREEYLMSLSNLAKVLKERGRFDLTTKFVALQSERARQVWEQHLRACIGCYRQVKSHSLMH